MVTELDKKTALVLIDLQKSVVQYQFAKPVKEILENVIELVNAFRKAALPVVLVNVDTSGAAWLKTRKDSISAPRAASTADSLKITPEILTHPDDIYITKHTWSAFYGTALDEELKQRNITGIVLAGISTSIGVEGTARGASERGYNIAFARDAMTDMVADAHENSLKYIFPRMGEIDDTVNIIGKLLLLFPAKHR
jgi:nicotinamidase-related amidase